MAQHSALGHAVKTLVGLALLAGCGFLAYVLYRNRPAPPEPEPLAPKSVAVEVQHLEPEDFALEVQVTGTVQPARRGRLTGRTAGQVIWVAPAIEQLGRCAGDQVLVKLDETDPSIAEKRARAALKRATARLAQSEVRLSDAKTQAELAAAALVLAGRELDRALGLARDGTVSTQEVERRKLQENQQRSASEARRRQQEAALAERDMASAEVELARQDLAAAHRRIEDSSIRAPFTGRITRQVVERGDWVVPGQTLADLAQIERVKVRLHVASEEIDSVDPGDHVRLSIRALEDLQVAGRIEAVAADADPRTRTFEVIALADNTDPPRILPGMFATATIEAAVWPGTLAIPRPAVCTATSGTHGASTRSPDPAVYVVDPDRMIAHRREISIRRWVGEIAVVESGLEAGEWIVTAGVEWLCDGARVVIEPSPRPVGSPGGPPASPSEPGG